MIVQHRCAKKATEVSHDKAEWRVLLALHRGIAIFRITSGSQWTLHAPQDSCCGSNKSLCRHVARQSADRPPRTRSRGAVSGPCVSALCGCGCGCCCWDVTPVAPFAPVKGPMWLRRGSTAYHTPAPFPALKPSSQQCDSASSGA